MSMFTKNKMLEPTKTTGATTTIIGAGTQLNGDVTCANDLRIDGKLTGNIYCHAKIVIGSDGFVEGEINGQNADVMGKIIGNIKIKELLNLRGKAVVKGEIYTGSLQMEAEVTFNGVCHMGASIIDMNNVEIVEKKLEAIAK